MQGYIQNLPSLKVLGSRRVTLKHSNLIINRQGVGKRKTNSPIIIVHLKRMSHKYTTPFLTLFPIKKQMSLAF